MTGYHAEIQGALMGVESLELASLGGAELAVALTAVGDALRAGMSIPPGVRRQLEQLAKARYTDALTALTEDVGTWRLPAELEQDEEPSPSFELAIVGRDRVDSALSAMRRFLLPRGVSPDGLTEGQQLTAAIASLDWTCSGTATRDAVEEALGVRAALGGRGDWLESFEERATDGRVAVEAASKEAGFDEPPSDETCHAYIRQGQMARYVEAVASRSDDFAEELAEMIEASRECGGTVGLVARRWLKERASKGGPIELAVLPTQRMAAADASVELAAEEVIRELGELYPVDAVATLVAREATVTVRVFPADGTTLRLVRLGHEMSRAADGEGVWSVSAAVGGAPIDLVVEDEAGARFQITLRFGPESG